MFGNNSSGTTPFGGSSFNTSFGATPTLGAFGSTTQQTVQPAGPIGTTIRFVPLSGTDTVQKTGTGAGATQITTRHQNISAMKEYETKSVDELRLEDYSAGRKVGQPQTAFGSGPFSTMQPSTSQQNTSIFGSLNQPSTNLFGATPAQNQTTSIFGQPKTGLEANNTSNIFGSSLNKPVTGNSTFNLGTQFGANTSNTTGQSGFPLFNNNTQTGFGTSTVNSPFKSTNMFASQPTSTGSIFNTSNTTSTFGFLNNSQSSTTNPPFGTPSQPTTNLFATPSSNQTSSIFGQPKTGTSNTPSSSGFLTGGQSNTPNQLFGSSLGTSNLNFGQQNTSTSLFNVNPLQNTQTNPLQQNQPLNNLQPTSQSTSLQPSTSQQNTSIFGSLNQPSTNLFGATPAQNQTTGILGQPKTGLEANSTSSIFGSSLNKPVTSNSTFNLGTQFGANTSNTTGQSGFPLFNNNTQTGFGTSTVESPFKSTNMFASQPTSTGSIFNTSNTTSTFGFLNNSQSSTTTNPPFGTTSQPTTSLFAAPASNQTSSIFGQPKTGTNNITSTGFLTGGQTTATNQLFGNTSGAGNLSFGQQNTVQQSPQSPDLLLNRLKTLPYGETSLYLNDSGSSPGINSLKFTTDPKTINQYKINAKTSVKLNTPTSSEKMKTNSVLFDGLDDNKNDDLKCAIDVFVPKRNIKKLDLKPNSYLSEGDSEHVNSSQAFEQRRSSLTSRLQRDHTTDGETSLPHNNRQVRYADNTFPGEDLNPNSTFPSNITALSSTGSELSSLRSSSYNRSNLSNQSNFNTTGQSNRISFSSRSGVIHTRPDYKIKPSLDELERCYNSESGTCFVDSFLIERPNYGSILFESRFDVKGLNLDEIVNIRRKEVVVYPDDSVKPPIGQGLNRPATVTLHQVWPIDKSNNEIIKDIDRLNLMRYPEKVESATIEKGARFIEYRPETGSWVFAVKHFSKYGITDDDEDQDQNMIHSSVGQVQSAAPLQPQNQSTQNIQPSPQNNGFLLNRLRTSPQNDSPSLKNNIRRPAKEAVYSTPNIKDDSNAALHYRMSPKTIVKLNKSTTLDESKSNSALFDSMDNTMLSNSMRNVIDELFEDDEDVDVTKSDLKRSLSVHGTKRLALQNVSPNISSSSFVQPIVTGAAVPTQQKVRELKLKPDLYAAQNKYSRDIMSVCVSGAPRVRFFGGSRMFCYANNDSIVVNELKLVPNTNDGELTDELKERFEVFLANNSLIASFNMIPTLAPYIETNDFISNASSHDLLHALYGNLSSKTPYAKQEERMTRIINWLAAVNRKIEPPTNLYHLIIYHMSCDRYDLASTVAMDNNHPRLALLVATLNLNKDLMFEQLSSWRLSTADQYIDPELMKIYIILSGLTEWRLSNDKTVYCLKGLKWTQQLCLLALHVTSFVSEPDKYGFHLLPLYMTRLDTNTNDVDYHILARHSPTNILSAADTLIEEWFLLESLKSFHVINSESECMNSDIIHCNLASQMGPVDLRWACYVALHIINNEVRNQVLIRLLEQNHGQFKEEKRDLNRAGSPMTVESWLMEKLKVPEEFISKAKSLAEKSS